MKRISAAASMLLLLASLSTPALGQGGFFATVTGTVTDATKAIVPGATIKATAVATGVISTTLTNDAGAYTFQDLLPGKYSISASLPGFQTRTLTDVQLSQNTSYRYNFELSVAGVDTQIEVSFSADSVLATSGASVGQVLGEQKVQDLPHVGNNVLDLITVMAGVENIIPTNPPSAFNAFGRENTTFAGVSASNVTVARDGIMVQDVRYPTGIQSATTINPDMVGEIRLILAPVDAEIGRGNGTIQISTRSGTNQYNGSAVWSFRNTALDPNTWGNNQNQTLPLGSPPGTVPQATQPDWANVHQGTISFGGPIIRNKTFFFALFDLNFTRQRTSTQTTVLTPCARNGIFRYYDGWNNGNVFTTLLSTGPNPIRPAVNADGSPNPPSAPPSGTGPYDNTLRYISVYGPLSSQPTTPDCSDAPINTNTLVPNGVAVGALPGAGGGWDVNRQQIDPTGFMNKTLGYMPTPNNYEAGDGLNTAGFRWLRHYSGLDNLFGVGEATGDRKQISVKVDHNFSTSHKANVNVTYERVDSDDVVEAWPDTFSNKNYRRPLVVTAGFTSTLSPSLLNEARFGMRRTGTNVIAPWNRPEYQEDLVNNYLFPNVNGFLVIPRIQGGLPFCYPHSGVRPPGGCGLGFGFPPPTAAVTNTAIDRTPVYTFADTLSWTHGAHSFKFGGEARFASSESQQSGGGFFSDFQNFGQANGGTIPGFAPGTSGPTDIANTNPAMTGLLGTNSTNARNVLNYLSASLASVSNFYFVTDPNQLTTWSDYRNETLFTKKIIQKEFTVFVKDDYKVSKDLTLNLGVRWEYFGVPFVDSGLTVAPVGGGAAAFGISGRDFTGWMTPGARAPVTDMEFVGPNSPNPDKRIYPKDFNNFGPAVGFAWTVPWFGAGKTTVRGGYQVTFQGGGRFDELQNGAFPLPGPLGAPPGSTYPGIYQPQAYLDLTSLNAALPTPTPVQPMQPLPTSNRTAGFATFDPNFVAPYVQNLTLSVTRSLGRAVTLDVRYVGTLSRKQRGTLNLNSANFLYNGLVDDLERVRTGTEITKTAADPKGQLDQIFDRINLCGDFGACTGGLPYGPIGTTAGGVYQSAAYQMRNSTTFNTNLANANFLAVAQTLNTLNYSPTANPTLPVQPGFGGVLRLNGSPENFIATNPQFGPMGYYTNTNYNNYHALQFQASLRPVQGFSGQATYSWSKNLGITSTLTNPVDRALDYTTIGANPGHSLRANGTMDLPFGPNKLFFGNSSGAIAYLIEGWQLGLIYNLFSGAPTSITATSMLYANGVPDVVVPIDFNSRRDLRWGIPSGSFEEGRYFDNNDTFVKFDDPLCNSVTDIDNLSLRVNGVQTRCTLDSLWMAVGPGVADATPRVFPDGVTRPAILVLQHPQPGTRGNLGQNTVFGLGSWRFDASLAKMFRIKEDKSLQIRLDAQNVLNHPQPAAPNFSITGPGTFGQVSTTTGFFGTVPAKSGGRLLQGQLRFNF